MKLIDLTGKRFGRLVVVGRHPHNRGGHAKWECMCDCGKTAVVVSDRLLSGKTRSCGCYKRQRSSEAHTIHGGSGTRLHNIWNLMRARCDDLQNPLYGGRGITVCEEWREFPAFRDWALNNGYSDSLSLDRIDADGNYEPANCRWATDKVQQNNKRNNRLITFNGETHTLAEWADKIQVPIPTLWNRLFTLSWPLERALTTPRKEPRHEKPS